jgi:hypothetical protein
MNKNIVKQIMKKHIVKQHIKISFITRCQTVKAYREAGQQWGCGRTAPGLVHKHIVKHIVIDFSMCW